MVEKQAKQRSRMRTEQLKTWIFYFSLVGIPLVQFLICYVGVNFNSVLLSFKTYTSATDYRWGFENFERIFTTEWTTVLNSLQNSLTAFFARVLVGMTLGLLFSYYVFKKMAASNFFKIVLFLPTIVSQIVMVIVYRQFVDEAMPVIFGSSNELGLISQGKIDPSSNTLFTIIIIYNIWVGFGTQVLMYLGAMNNISDGALEACQIDGANAVQEFIYVVFPGIFSTFTVFNYPSNDAKDGKGATLTTQNDITNAAAWLKLYDLQGNALSVAKPDTWFRAVINITDTGVLAAGGFENLNLALVADPDTTAYLADAKFLKEEIDYTVEHYKKVAGEYVLDESLTETYSVAPYTKVSATYKSIDGYLPISNSLAVSSGVVVSEGLTLKFYYDEAVKIANTENKGYLYSLSGDANFGASALTIEKQSQKVADVENAYKLTSTATTTIRIVGVDNTYAKNNGYQKLVFSIYLSKVDANNRPFIKIVDTAGATSSAVYLEDKKFLQPSKFVRVYNEDGVRMSAVVQGQWCTVEVDLANVGSRVNGEPRMHVEIHTTTNQASYSYYIANASLSKETFNKAESPIAVSYNGATVGYMVSNYYAGRANNVGGLTGVIISNTGMRMKATEDGVEVSVTGTNPNRQNWLQIQGVSQSYIQTNNITTLTFEYYYDSSKVGNALLRTQYPDKDVYVSLTEINRTDKTLSRIFIDGQAKQPATGWNTITVSLSGDGYLVKNWDNSTISGLEAWDGLYVGLCMDSGSFKIKNVKLS